MGSEARTDIGDVFRRAFDAVYVINLPDRTDRRAEVAAELSRIGLAFDDGLVRLFRAIRPDTGEGWPTRGTRGAFESHLGVLDDALSQGYETILVLEDDVSLSPSLIAQDAAHLEALLAEDWSCLYGGPIAPDLSAAPVTFSTLDSDQGLIGLHFVAFRAPFMRAAQKMLDAFRQRPEGHPDGGRMHVDGAYNHVRMAHPDFRAALAVPGLAYQRASRTDVHDLKWFDRLPGASAAVALLRRWKNSQRA